MIHGTFRMPKWSVDSYSVDMQYQPWEMPILGLALVPSLWMMWCARGRNLRSGSAGAKAGSPTTVATVKMLQSFAQVPHDVIHGRPLSPPTCYRGTAKGWWLTVFVAQFGAGGGRWTGACQLVPSAFPLQEAMQGPRCLRWVSGPWSHYAGHTAGVQCVLALPFTL